MSTKFKYLIPMWLTEAEHAAYVARNQAAEKIFNDLMETYDRKTSKFLVITGVNGYEVIQAVTGKGRLWSVGATSTVADAVATQFLYYTNIHPAETFTVKFASKDQLPEGYITEEHPSLIRSCRFSPEMDAVYGRK
jgi:hypothetical protein